jgi:hypothetical protein
MQEGEAMSAIQLELTTLRRDWIEESFPLVVQALQDKRTFTSDDLYNWNLGKPECVNWYGALMAKLSKSKIIRKIGYQTSTRKQANGRVVAVWERV